jgi:chemotaxis protein methyltransferase CheR
MAPSSEMDITPKEFGLFRDLIYELTGITLSDAKRNLVCSRLQKRLRAHNLTRFTDYYHYLIAHLDTEERAAFINCITTNKTDFFREPHHFEFVTRTVIPQAIGRVQQGTGMRRLRIWHAGCSTGEEPYTLAMVLQEALNGNGHWDVRQLASDIDTDVLAHASRGIYARDRIDTIPPELLRRHFLRGKGDFADSVMVKPQLKAQITFRQINLLHPFPFGAQTRFDMIFCRNVVIYFDKATQRDLFARFAQCLRPGGYLFIGHSETLAGVSDQFQNIGATIYQLPEISRQESKAA